MIHNGLDLARILEPVAHHNRQTVRANLGIAQNEVTIVLLGTVCERKGQKDLVGAFGMMPEDLGRVLRLFIVGDRANEYSAQLHATADALLPSLAARVRIISETGDPYRYLEAADIAVCCSRVESY